MASYTNLSLFIKRVELPQTETYIRETLDKLNYGKIHSIKLIPRINALNVHKYNGAIIYYEHWNNLPNTIKFLNQLALSDKKLFHSQYHYWYITQNTSIDIDQPSNLKYPEFPPLPEHSDTTEFLINLWKENVSLKNQLNYYTSKIVTQQDAYLNLDCELQNMYVKLDNQQMEIENLQLDNVITNNIAKESIATNNINTLIEIDSNYTNNHNFPVRRISYEGCLELINNDSPVNIELQTSDTNEIVNTVHNIQHPPPLRSICMSPPSHNV